MKTEHEKMLLEQNTVPNVSLDTMDKWLRWGCISDDEYDHYAYHWRNQTFRYSHLLVRYTAKVCPVCGVVFPEREGGA